MLMFKGSGIVGGGGAGDFDYTNLIMRQRADSITGKSTGDALTAPWADMTRQALYSIRRCEQSVPHWPGL
jgi:hypothetical protein